MSRLLLLPCLLSVLTLSACQSTPESPSLALNPDAARAQALARSARLSNINYHYQLTLNPDAFSGKADIQFVLSDNRQPLSLDAVGMQLSGVTINGRYLYPDYDGKQITLSPTLLEQGDNQLVLNFRGQYQSAGNGLISFMDPVDGKQYLYSHFEPEGASRLLPLFDQPNLPADFTLEISAPNEWQLISSSRQAPCQSAQPQGLHCSAFNTGTLPLSPHNISLYAGPFASWHSQQPGMDNAQAGASAGKLPLSLYARASQQQLVDANAWLGNTQSALIQLQQRLGTPFPFEKYDQLLMMQDDELAAQLPHSGAAAVAFIRSASPDNQTLSYQLARQWFGNMVSMDWWNNRWLSEAISQFLAGETGSGAARIRQRESAYESDVMPLSGHAVGQPTIYLSHDPIIRTKAVAALTQLQAQLGSETFNRVLAAYLQQFQGQSADAGNFIRVAETVSGQSLDSWYQDFISSRGVNRIKVELECRDGIIDSLKLKQAADSEGRLRHQQLLVGLYHTDRSGIHRDKVLKVELRGADTEVPQASNLVCPDLIWPNEQGLGYLKVTPDNHSLTASRLQLGQIHAQSTGLMIWQSLWQALLDGELSRRDYLAKLLLNVPAMTDMEQSKQIQSQMLRLRDMLAASQAPYQDSNLSIIDAMTFMSLQRAMETATKPGLQQTWLNTYISLARDPQSLDHLSQLLTQAKGPLPALTRQQEFAALMQLTRYDHASVRRHTQQALRDETLTQTQHLQLRAISPKAVEKRALLAKLPLLPADSRQQVMAKLFPAEQTLLSDASFDERLVWLQDTALSLPFRTDVARYLLGSRCSHAALDKLTRLSQQQTEPELIYTLEQQALWVNQCLTINHQSPES